MEKTLRRWLFFALALSLAANVGHTILADSVVPVWLRMIGAVAWPILVYGAVHITVTVAWELLDGRKPGTWIARLSILIPGVPALITSYEHMHAVLLAMGERPFIAMIGPGAVDLFMIGITMTIVRLRRTAATAPVAKHAESSVEDFEIAPWRPGPERKPVRHPEAPGPNGEPSSTLPPRTFLPNLIDAERVRKPRATRPALEKAVGLLLDGQTVDQAVQTTELGASTLRRYKKVIGMIRAGQPVDAGKEKVQPEMVKLIASRTAAT